MSADYEMAYAADRSIRGKVRRRLARLIHRRPARRGPGRPLLTISFDDAPLTATGTGAEILKRHDVKGTFYAAAGLAGRLEPMGVCAGQDDYVRLARQGHEIGCHTYSHLDCGRASAPEAVADVRLNADAFMEWGLPGPESFAFPFGDVAPGPKAALGKGFSSLRGLHPGLITRGADLNQAPAIGIEGVDGPATALHWMERAQAESAWLILYTHDVQEAPSPWGCTPQALDMLLTRAVERGFEFATVREGVARVSA